MTRTSWLGSSMALLLLACGEGPYLYQPTTMISGSVEGTPASRYEIPPESPRGEVTVASFGVTHMDRKNGGPLDLVHARLVVNNNNDQQAWTVDPARQLVTLPGHEPAPPAYVNSSVPIQPQATVAPGQKMTLDLFYPLPPDRPKASAVPDFDLLWQVDTGTRAVAQRTTFERLRVTTPADYPYPAYAWADWWWADPWWFGPVGPGYVGPGPGYYWRDPLAPRFVTVHPPSRVIVHQPRYMARPAPPPPPHATPAAPVRR